MPESVLSTPSRTLLVLAPVVRTTSAIRPLKSANIHHPINHNLHLINKMWVIYIKKNYLKSSFKNFGAESREERFWVTTGSQEEWLDHKNSQRISNIYSSGLKEEKY